MGLKTLLNMIGIGRKSSMIPTSSLTDHNMSITGTMSTASNMSATGIAYNNVTSSWVSPGITNLPTYVNNINNISGSPVIVGSTYTVSSSGNATIGTTLPPNIISLHNQISGEIVRLNTDGSVTWANGIQIDEAAEAFGKAIKIGGELSAGITKSVKQRMRDTVFEEIIELAKIKGALTVDELTFMHQSAKIVDKLRGGYEED